MNTTTYTIRPGDSLFRIAGNYDIFIEALLAINPHIENPDVIFVGNQINVPDSFNAMVPEWYIIAKKELFTKEIKGTEHNPRIIEYHQSTNLKATSDEVAWCSSFANWCVQTSGSVGTQSAAARSWLKWGKVLKEPVIGCIVVLKRGNSTWQGHVGFYAGKEPNTPYIKLLGGNQGNSVSIANYHENRVLGYRI